VAVQVAVGAAALVLLVVGTAAASLHVYGLSLALFGLAHVAYETRDVDGRFSSRLPRTLWVVIGLLLLSLVVLRAGFILHLLPRSW
jgi:hypothetical protein